MENIKVQKRDFTVKAKKLRRLGVVPGSVFGKSLPESISIQMEEGIARRLVREKREGSKLPLSVDGQIIPVQIKEKSLNTLNGEILHISFQALTTDEKVNSVIHILLANEKKFGGQLEKMLMEIPYASFPEDMIDTLTIDVDGLKTGDVLTVKDIPELMQEKIELQVDTDEIVLRIVGRRQQEVSEE
ncbi:50S ribosomal protein L25/general stress protein Ctc [Frisingicoccus sp.]|uniref:50S ribosomal protein L25/general stress protein Ctc n=1 Tax=Frisingicoccus sp. TaxID=1918627 RepID=UPI003AB32F63